MFTFNPVVGELWSIPDPEGIKYLGDPPPRVFGIIIDVSVIRDSKSNQPILWNLIFATEAGATCNVAIEPKYDIHYIARNRLLFKE